MGIGANIMECPNCHYSNYQINITIESRFTNYGKVLKKEYRYNL